MPFKLASVFHSGQTDVGSDTGNGWRGKGKRFAWQFMRKNAFVCLLLNQKATLHFSFVSGKRMQFSCKSSVGEAHNGSAKTPLCPADHCPG